jgi:hypothetical protein
MTQADESPPEKKVPATLAGDERQEPNPQTALCKAWMRCGPRARREFLSDVRAAHPALWEQASKEALP